jgi:hypothetical protein
MTQTMIGLEPRDLRERVRPLRLGASVGTRYGSGGGSLGYFVTHMGHAGFLTTATALKPSQGALEANEPVYQPSSIDAGTLKSSDIIGRIEQSTALRDSATNVADAALVMLRDDIEWAGNVLPSFPSLAFGKSSLSTPSSLEEISLGQQVAKVGRTTGYTVGTLTAVALSSLRVKAGRNTIMFNNLAEIQSEEPFSGPGDSGALVFTIPHLVPIGLVVASSWGGTGSERTRYTFACSLEKVMQLFDVRAL